jgi:hypothetical protein
MAAAAGARAICVDYQRVPQRGLNIYQKMELLIPFLVLQVGSRLSRMAA